MIMLIFITIIVIISIITIKMIKITMIMIMMKIINEIHNYNIHVKKNKSIRKSNHQYTPPLF